MKRVVMIVILCSVMLRIVAHVKVDTVKVEYRSSCGMEVIGFLYIPDISCRTDKLLIKVGERNPVPTTQVAALKKKNSFACDLLGKGIAYYEYFFPEVMNPVWESLNYGYMDIARDAKDALNIWKGMDMTRHMKLGLTGTGSSGCAAVVLASESSSVDFLVILSSNLTEGKDFVRVDFRLKDFILPSAVWMKQCLADTSFIFKGNSFEGEKMEEAIARCLYETIDSVVQYIYDYGKDDTMIQKKSALIIKDLWNGTHFKAEMKKGKTDGFDIWVDSMFSQSFFSKNNAIQMYQWRPEKYYAKIDIPVYIGLSGNDKSFNCEDNYDKALSIKRKYKKSNFEIVFFRDLGHGLSRKKIEYDVDLKTKSESNETFVYNYYIMDEMAKKELISWIVNLK